MTIITILYFLNELCTSQISKNGGTDRFVCTTIMKLFVDNHTDDGSTFFDFLCESGEEG